jgi:hypothetical protein
LYNSIQNPAIQVGSGTAIAILAEFQLINIYMPTNTTHPTRVGNALKKYMETIPLDRKAVSGGD